MTSTHHFAESRQDKTDGQSREAYRRVSNMSSAVVQNRQRKKDGHSANKLQQMDNMMSLSQKELDRTNYGNIFLKLATKCFLSV